MRLQPIFDIAEICAQKGVQNAVLCPGSRSAPLTLAFVNHPDIQTRTFSDERSAAFVANGMSLETQTPTALVCTSGSAAYNFAPAVAEAYFQQIPLLVFTADRPREWIDQYDGQTIRQFEIFGKHVKQSFELPQEYDHDDLLWQINRIVNDAINIATSYPQGPVHINVPLREPLYPKANEKVAFSKEIRVVNKPRINALLDVPTATSFQQRFLSHTKVLIVVGQTEFDSSLTEILQAFSKSRHVPVVAEIISNQHVIEEAITHADILLTHSAADVKKSLQPELLITIGKSVLSKSLKQFLRTHTPKEHWVISQDEKLADTFKSATEVISILPAQFFKQLNFSVQKSGFEAQKRENYFRTWEAKEHQTARAVSSFFKDFGLSEFNVVDLLLKNLTIPCNLHLANSMPVRYANAIGLTPLNKEVRVFCNRGTSGIDGATSTALGQSLISDHPTVLITGDMAFFYDRNAFWHNYPTDKLRILVLNNHGGAIFSMIDGPAGLGELKEYFVTNQKLSARHICSEFDFDYLKLDNTRKVKNLMKDFLQMDGRTKIMEVETDAVSAKQTMDQFKQHIKKSYES
ncbi:MAG: 2-succinyl-5-enolpyruvyl-6-hydroxy-3-cyclohexene-1-carboxylic-acid synthase [Cyclobacteriaceae bacterium]